MVDAKLKHLNGIEDWILLLSGENFLKRISQ